MKIDIPKKKWCQAGFFKNGDLMFDESDNLYLGVADHINTAYWQNRSTVPVVALPQGYLMEIPSITRMRHAHLKLVEDRQAELEARG